MNMVRLRLTMIVFVLICTSTVLAQTRRHLLPTDLSVLKEVSDAQISPDGLKIVYVITETTPDRARTISRLWTVPASGGEAKRLTIGEANESTPRWSPDGKWIAFYSDRENRDGLWVTPADGGAPKPLVRVYRTNFFLNKAGESFCWAPDSRRIAFLSSIEVLGETPAVAAANTPAPTGVPPAALRPLSREDIEKLPIEVREMLFRAQGQAMGMKPQSPIENALSPIPDDPRVITRLQYKSRTSFSDNFQSHIFVIDLESRQVRQITTGLLYEHSIDWSPKGDEIAFVSNREPDPDKVNNTDLFTVNVNTFAIRQLTKTKGCEWQPVFSPDGGRIAYLATKREITTIDSVAEDTHPYIISAQGGEPRDVSLTDNRASFIRWWRDGKNLAFAAANKGYTVLLIGDGYKGTVLIERVLGREAQITSLSIGKTKDIVFTAQGATHPSELYAQTAEFSQSTNSVVLNEARQLTNANEALRTNLQFSSMHQFRFKNDDFEIEGWLVPPPDLSEKLERIARLKGELENAMQNASNQGKRASELQEQLDAAKKAASDLPKYPVILSIHGGPHGMHGYGFNTNAQAMAAHGYAVLLINPRGSSGYGQKFADGCINDWGGGDYRDLMKGVDEALARWPFLDKDRMGVAGGSYGGYMTNWVVTQTDRFKAAVASASLSNILSFYSTSLYQDLVHAEFNGFPWNNFELLWDRSPLKHITKAKTPLLLLHGEQDNDVHITQAEEMYTAMRMQGIDCVFVRYPREGHGMREPRHREDALARTLQWFDRYLKR